MLCFRSQQVARNCFCKMCFYDNMNVRFCLWLFYVCLEELELLHRESCSVRCLEFVMFTKCNKPMVLNPSSSSLFILKCINLSLILLCFTLSIGVHLKFLEQVLNLSYYRFLLYQTCMNVASDHTYWLKGLGYWSQKFHWRMFRFLNSRSLMAIFKL